ncbi:MAG TPA: hypothetical protein VJQ43_00475, partial [Thermoplasmata archaeon]|nr:hypothetical protein [Thermoplasmata archaeon]
MLCVALVTTAGPPVAGSRLTAPGLTLAVPPATNFSVSFQETGLPPGSAWSVTLGGSTQNGTTAILGFRVGNGTYPFTFGSVRGYQTPAGGTLHVSGENLTRVVTYVANATPTETFAVNFTAKALPTGTWWNVTFNGTRQGSPAQRIGFVVANGTYPFAVSLPIGLLADPNQGSIHVNGSAQSVPILLTIVHPSG